MNSVAERSAASSRYDGRRAKIRALMGGTAEMRAQGGAYLPQFPSESDESYKIRLGASWLFNGTEKTVEDMAGRVFEKPTRLADDAPEEVAKWAENIDLAGRHLSNFARDVFEDALQSGISYIMVDAPVRDGDVSKAEAQTRNLRPYFVHLRSEDILGWRTEVVDNQTVLAQIRIMETETEVDPKDEFKEIEIQQVRVMDRIEGGVHIRLFRKSGDKQDWTLHDERFSPLEEITVVPVYVKRTAFFEGRPPLENLADVNIAHWRSQSDQQNILHVARVPILFGKGMRADEKNPIVISSSQATTTEEPEADLKWVEHSGEAIGAGRTDLKDLEFQMQTHGLQLLVTKTGNNTATGDTIDDKKSKSTLAMSADDLQDALETAFLWAGQYAGRGDEIKVQVNKEFEIAAITAHELNALLSAVNTGQISRETFIGELIRRGVISDVIDVADELERIDDEGDDLIDNDDVEDDADSE